MTVSQPVPSASRPTAQSSSDPRTVGQVQEWAKKLIDLSKRNRLLLYRETRRTTLVFRSPGPDPILGRLLDGRPWSFYRPPEIPRPIPGVPQQITPLETVLQARPPGERELVTTQRDPAEIDRSLEAIERKARAELEDRGTHVLHLVWGLVRWQDPRGEELVAPILLVPVVLRRASVRERFELVPVTDDDPVVNPALRVKLETDLGKPFPELDLDDVPAAEVATAVLERLPKGGRVDPYAGLGLFSFAKEAIYRDLNDHAEAVAQHPLIRSIARGSLVADAKKLQAPVPAEEQLDDVQKPADSDRHRRGLVPATGDRSSEPRA